MNYNIYIIKNLLNEKKIYIGCTTKSLKERFNEHKTFSKIFKSRNLYIDFNKLGIDNFKIELLETVIKNPKEKEDFYINKYKKNYELYNMSLSNFQKKVYCYNLENNKITKFENLSEAKNAGFDPSKISQIVNIQVYKDQYRRILHKNCLWSYKNNKKNWENLISLNNNKKCRKLKIINTTTGQIFDSIAEANTFYNLKRKSTAINNNLKKKTKKCMGFVFEYLE